MKLSDNTLNVLKNFATINQGLVIRPGSILRTINSNRNILAEATVEEEFPMEFGIYDLNKILSVLTHSKVAVNVEFEKESLVFESVGKVRVRHSPVGLIVAPPNKSINIPSYDVEFKLSADILNWINNTASILKAPNIVVKSDGGDISVLAMDVKGKIVDDASVKVEGKSHSAFQAVFLIENLKMMNGGYTVELSSSGVAKFSHAEKKLVYWISTEKKDSKFE